MPLLTISRITSDEEVAGPSVQTTLVRSMNRYQEKKRGGPAGGGSRNCGLHPKGGQHPGVASNPPRRFLFAPFLFIVSGDAGPA